MKPLLLSCPLLALTLSLVACPDRSGAGGGDAPGPAASTPAPTDAGSVPASPSTSTAAKTPHAPGATSASPAASPGARSSQGATNEDGIARYPDEKPLPDIADHINWDMRVRTAPSTKDGDVIVALRAGTPVTKLAKRGQWFLIVFADPGDKAHDLMGWTWEQAFFPLSGPGNQQKLCSCWQKENPGSECDAVAGLAMGECDRTYGDDCAKLIACVHGQLPPQCMPGERLLTPQGVCAKTCTRNADCPNDAVCTEQLGDPHVCRPAKVLTE